VILTFRHKGLERFFRTGSVSGIQAKHASKLRLLLAQLDMAATVDDMDLPGLRLHPLKGDRKGSWAVTVQANWRMTFRFDNGNAEVVDYEDYH